MLKIQSAAEGAFLGTRLNRGLSLQPNEVYVADEALRTINLNFFLDSDQTTKTIKNAGM